jgi:hypothetical protein
MINLCMCGAEPSYPHDVCCPFPLFNARDNDPRAQEWEKEYAKLATDRCLCGSLKDKPHRGSCPFPIYTTSKDHPLVKRWVQAEASLRASIDAFRAEEAGWEKILNSIGERDEEED